MACQCNARTFAAQFCGGRITPMASLVIELQRLAAESNASVTELLRKALIVASKLKIEDFKEWINCELQGYGDKEVPEYRRLTSEVKMFHPYHGWKPLFFETEETAERF